MMRNSKKGIVIWLTGLPCSGKTSISKEIEKYFKEKNIPIQRLDGDVVRETISRDLKFSKKDRDLNIERLSYVVEMLANNGVNVVSAFVTPYQKMRDFARSLCENFIEVHVNCSIKECKRRDIKGMYAKAAKGEIKDFTGVQDPYEIPIKPEIVVNTEEESIEESLKKIIDYIKKKNAQY